MSAFGVSAQVVDATQALNRSAGVANPRVLRGRGCGCIRAHPRVPTGIHDRTRLFSTPDYAAYKDECVDADVAGLPVPLLSGWKLIFSRSDVAG